MKAFHIHVIVVHMYRSLYCVPENRLKEHLMEELDYSLVPQEGWVKLIEWYGMAPGSRPIARKVVEFGLYTKHIKVEVYLLEFKLTVHPNLTEHTIEEFSRLDSVGKYYVAITH